ncbi:bifunctional hydroxymethylpyrimidine kinase/phosphomethylpyrimidine kinase [Bacillus swezeyi]|uniref:Hydroxymethylpyrimidine/phosphomethylpyrimidine kinase n=1 Tax=Bacillus swezeyi TaxID=1925020 RepID=A0A1R1QBM9_9BACI|nr:bifunctional hydroxymethylpyrimidine kinase/phosphomethylpyrimidine kinase [Bacillus swezeyi]MEC1261506.1 bifunctional hydroxymethylpyrimidine kinase/phosphomethylpyrimidine kinase [Bacillus swezeyi]MED2926631.1 bifunctional hydroxymethylpyrimidine kinase/phosphomethylpyrimidine kinase [Bacillus swezeyi]MED2965807.1 bifunctional hydroxymethylpyrimidine kinase/phosphomethylpyrimidine kinase [Bacillus swezeyi]MED3070790.1 bifunctional hydroxymethylpyrimidine kinase/phosphomethylpyrimidine kina
MSIFKALTIAGSDSGGGAGIQADLKTFQELEVFGMTALTAITAQNTTGVHGVYPLSPETLGKQIEAVAEDLRPDAIKTGMLWSAEMIEVIAEKIAAYDLENVIVDPVMIAKGGASLLNDEAVEKLTRRLLPLAYAVTPNIPEAEVLTGRSLKTMDDRKKAAQDLCEMGVRYSIIKGGHQPENEKVTDLLFDGETFIEISNPYIETKNTHGTGCTFAAALTAQTAKGNGIHEAFQVAEAFVHEAVAHSLDIGAGHGPTNHFAFKKSFKGSLRV